jgi:hypothetical protein
MGAIGSYAILRRSDFPACVEVHFTFVRNPPWQAAVVEGAHFDYSGYVLGNYLDAQQVVNQIQVVNEQSEVARALCKMFTAAFPFEVPVTLPDLAPEPLFEFCREDTAKMRNPWWKPLMQRISSIKKVCAESHLKIS